MEKKIIYIDMDDVLCNYTELHRERLKKEPNIKYPQSQYGFFRKLEAKKGGIEGLNYLRSQNIFDIYILTAPSVKNPLCYSEKREWVEEKLGIDMVNRLIITPNKGLNKGDYLIDDHREGKGQDTFEGELIWFGSVNYPSWKEVIGYFREKYELK